MNERPEQRRIFDNSYNPSSIPCWDCYCICSAPVIEYKIGYFEFFTGGYMEDYYGNFQRYLFQTNK